MGTEEGLSRLLPSGRFETLTVADGLAGNYVVSLFEDRSGALWVGAIDGLSRIRFDAARRPFEVRSFRAADGLPVQRSYDIAEDAGGRLFVAHGEGLSYRDGDRFRQVGEDVRARYRQRPRAGPDRRRHSLGRWLRPAGAAGLRAGKRVAPRFVSYGAASGLADLLVLTIADDREGRLLLGTNHGVLRFDPAARGGLGAVQARFDRASGAIASEVSHSNAFARDESGRSWFGFKGGLTGFPADLGSPRAPGPPPVLFERLATRSGVEFHAPFSGRGAPTRPQLGREPIVLAHQDSNLRVEVRALTFSGEGTAALPVPARRLRERLVRAAVRSVPRLHQPRPGLVSPAGASRARQR